MMTYCGSIVDYDILGGCYAIHVSLTQSHSRPCLEIILLMRSFNGVLIFPDTLMSFSSDFVLHFYSLLQLFEHSTLTPENLTHIRLSEKTCLASGRGSIKIHSDLIFSKGLRLFLSQHRWTKSTRSSVDQCHAVISLVSKSQVILGEQLLRTNYLVVITLKLLGLDMQSLGMESHELTLRLTTLHVDSGDCACRFRKHQVFFAKVV